MIYSRIFGNLRLIVFDFEGSILDSLTDRKLVCFTLLEVVSSGVVIDLGWRRLVVGVRFGGRRIR